jgi:hypothetical protein
MSGPFINYAIIDMKYNRILVLEGFYKGAIQRKTRSDAWIGIYYAKSVDVEKIILFSLLVEYKKKHKKRGMMLQWYQGV